MSDLSFTDAFARYGAKLANAQWAFSAKAEDGSLVLSCWQHKIRVENGVWIYSDCLSRWKLRNTAGRKMLAEHLEEAHKGKLRVRLIIVWA